MTPDETAALIARIDRLEQRYRGAGYKHVDAYLMPRDLMVKLRDHLAADHREDVRGMVQVGLFGEDAGVLQEQYESPQSSSLCQSK